MRVGVVGCGFIANIHSWALWAVRKAGLYDVHVVATCDRDAERAANLARPNDAEVLSVDALVRAVDIVYVCTPTAEHLAVVEQAAERGLPVFCEKPLGPDLAGAEAVAAALERVPHQVGLVLRASPVFTAIDEAISSGRFGRAMAVTMHDDQYFPIQGQYASTWRSEAAVAGGGTLIEHSIHDVDLFRWLLGDASEVTCRTAAFFGHEGIDDLAVATITFGQTVANLVSVWHQITSRPSTRRLEVFCEDAHLWTDDDNCGPLHIQTSSGDEVVECTPPAWVDELPVPDELRRPLGLYAEASRRFLAAVSTGTAGSPGVSEALAAHRIVDAAYRSARASGAPVSI